MKRRRGIFCSQFYGPDYSHGIVSNTARPEETQTKDLSVLKYIEQPQKLFKVIPRTGWFSSWKLNSEPNFFFKVQNRSFSQPEEVFAIFVLKNTSEHLRGSSEHLKTPATLVFLKITNTVEHLDFPASIPPRTPISQNTSIGCFRKERRREESRRLGTRLGAALTSESESESMFTKSSGLIKKTFDRAYVTILKWPCSPRLVLILLCSFP